MHSRAPWIRSGSEKPRFKKDSAFFVGVWPKESQLLVVEIRFLWPKESHLLVFADQEVRTKV